MQLARHVSPSSLVRHAGAAIALAAAPLVLGFLLLAPPASGEMLLVPMSGQARAELTGHLGDRAVRFISPGPLAGSLIVRGELPLLRTLLHDESVLILAVPDGGCGGIAA